MGYDVSIIRTQSGQPRPISEAEISEAIRKVPGWQFDPAEGTLEFFRDGRPIFWMSFGNGELWVKEPTEEQIGLMIELAVALGARVRGEELETYRTPLETFQHRDDADELRRRRQAANERAARIARRNKLIDRMQIGALLVLVLNFVAYVIHSLLAKGSA